MWSQFLDGLKKLILLKEQTDTNIADIKELQKDLKELTSVVRELIYEVRGNKRDEAHEREMIALQLENQLLKFERRLPAP